MACRKSSHTHAIIIAIIYPVTLSVFLIFDRKEERKNNMKQYKRLVGLDRKFSAVSLFVVSLILGGLRKTRKAGNQKRTNYYYVQ